MTLKQSLIGQGRSMRTMTTREWHDLGVELFGTKDKTKWRFKCPSCGVLIWGKEWIDADAEGMFAFSCIGRATGAKGQFLGKRGQPCDYAGGGLFGLNPIRVFSEGEDGFKADCFEFAPLGTK